MCAVKTSDVANVFYLVNTMTLAEVAYQGVVVSAPIAMGNLTNVNLTLPGSEMNNNSRKAILVNGTILESSAYLSVQGQCSN